MTLEDHYDVFISYRRKGGALAAKAVAEELRKKGYKVFFDADELGHGPFDQSIAKALESSKDFVLLLSPGALDGCIAGPEVDWVAKEITLAKEWNKNIVLFMLRGFTFPENMPQCIAGIQNMQGASNVDHEDPTNFTLYAGTQLCKYLTSVPDQNCAVQANSPRANQPRVAVFSQPPPATPKKSGIPATLVVGLCILFLAVLAGAFGYLSQQGEEPADRIPNVTPTKKTISPVASTTRKPSVVNPQIPQEKTKDYPTTTPPREAAVSETNQITSAATPARPTAPAGVSEDRKRYTLSRGDTAGRISKKLGCSIAELKKANPDFDFMRASVGSVINIPENANVRK